jgi:competence protein ComEC
VKAPRSTFHPAAILPCAAGILLVVYLPPGYAYRLLASALAFGLSLVVSGFALYRLKKKLVAAKPAGQVSLHPALPPALSSALLPALILGLCLGILAHYRTETLAGSESPGFCVIVPHQFQPAQVLGYEGVLVSDPGKTATGMHAYQINVSTALSTDGARATASGRISVYARAAGKNAPKLVRGQKVRIVISSGPLPPRVGAGAWTDALANRTVFINAPDIEPLEAPSRMESIRSKVRTAMLSALSSAGGRAGPLLEALIVGVRDDLDSGLALDFRAAGCVHILSLSGQHVGILASLVALALGFAVGLYRARMAACVLVGVYLFVVGASPSVLRAVLMFWISSAALLSDRPQKPLAILALAFVLVAIARPETVHTLSFKLSYLAMAGLAVFVPVYAFQLRRWLPPVLASALATGFGAMATTAPLTLIVFGTLNPLAPFTSAIAGPLVAALMYAGMAGAALVGIVPALRPVAVFASEGLWLGLSSLMHGAALLPSIAINEMGNRLLAAIIVAVAACIVYAWPYVSYLAESRRRSKTGQLRFPLGTFLPAGASGSGDAKKIRPELPHKRQRASPRRRPLRGGTGGTGLGNRPGNRIDDVRGDDGGTIRVSL